MSTSYSGKCADCRKNHPEVYVEIMRDNNNESTTGEYWCLECMHGNE